MSTSDNRKSMESQQNEAKDFIHEKEVCIGGHCNILASMFPNVDYKYIEEICINPPFESDGNNRMEMFVNHLLSYDDHLDDRYYLNSELIGNCSRLNNIEISGSENKLSDKVLTEILEQQDLQMMEIERQNEEKTNELLLSEFLKQDQEVVDEKINILENILPDADPEVLKKFVEENHENTMLLEEFVESKLTNKDYGKREKYYAKIRTREKIEQYTFGFSVEEFVKQFPEPFEYFENIEKEGIFQKEAYTFLKNRYPTYPEQYLANIYSKNKYNLSLTDKQLQTITDHYRVILNIEINDTALLQEIAFIQNKISIKLYLNKMKKEEEMELQVLRAQELLLECQCCYDELKPTDCIECDNNHVFCRKCVIKGTNLVISNSHSSVQCFLGCNKEINLNVLRKVLPECTFEMLIKRRQEADIKAAKLNDLVNCPFCPYQMELGSQIKLFTCKNPECMRITCRLCKKMNHLPIKCEDVLDEHKGRLYVEEEMSKALIRNCHNCQKPFIKDLGCNTMTCPCGAKMCYICRMPYRAGYSHSGCGRHINSQIFDQQLVASKRAEAIAKLHNDFPDMNVLKL